MSISEIILRIKREYTDGIMFNEGAFLIKSTKTIDNTGFMGSLNTVILNTDQIVMEAPGCIAAPVVNMVAKKIISIGMKGQGEHPVNARLFAPISLLMQTEHLSIGDLCVVSKTNYGAIFCEKLTFLLPKEESKKDRKCLGLIDSVEIIESWVRSDVTEIEKIKQ